MLDRGSLWLTVPKRHGPVDWGLSTTLRIASRIKSATLQSDRAAAWRNPSSSSFGK